MLEVVELVCGHDSDLVAQQVDNALAEEATCHLSSDQISNTVTIHNFQLDPSWNVSSRNKRSGNWYQ